MIILLCLDCRLALRVLEGDTAEIDGLVGARSEFWPDRYPCPSCERNVHGHLEQDLPSEVLLDMRLIDLSAQELFAALNGLGLPDEQACTGEVVRTLLRQPVRRIIGSDIPGTTRFRVETLELVDGTRLCFGSAPEGAIIYRIVRPTKYVERVPHG